MSEISEKSQKSFEQLWIDNANSFYLYILACLRNESDAQDILQIVAIRAYKGFNHLRNKDKFNAWGMRITRHAVIDHCNRQNLFMQVLSELKRNYVLPTIENDSEVLSLVAEYIQQQPSVWAKALYLQLYYEHTAIFISQLIKMPYYKTVSELRRMRRELRCILEENNYGPK